jgi:hypothetical protein
MNARAYTGLSQKCLRVFVARAVSRTGKASRRTDIKSSPRGMQVPRTRRPPTRASAVAERKRAGHRAGAGTANDRARAPAGTSRREPRPAGPHGGRRPPVCSCNGSHVTEPFHPAYASRICNTWMALASCPARQGSSDDVGEAGLLRIPHRLAQLRGAGREQSDRLSDIAPGCGRADPEPDRELNQRLAFPQVSQDQKRPLPRVQLPPERPSRLPVPPDDPGREVNGLAGQSSQLSCGRLIFGPVH